MAQKDVIIKFKRSTEVSAREAALDDIKKAGGSVVKSDNVGSTVFPYAVCKLSEDAFSGLQKSLDGHSVIDNCELDGKVHTQ